MVSAVPTPNGDAETIMLVTGERHDLGVLAAKLGERRLRVVGPQLLEDLETADGPADCAIIDLSSGNPALREALPRLSRALAPAVLVITTLEDSATRIAAVRLGVSEHVVAPFDVAEVVARVDVLLARRRRTRGARLDMGDVSVRLDERRVLRAGVDVPLTPRELEILIALMRARGRAVSKNELLQLVWKDDQRNVNAVEAHVSGLRRKLERHGSALIHTVHRAGYAFRPARPAAPTSREALLAERTRLLHERDEAFQRRDELLQELRRKVPR
jgi:two-component system, OmpR family, response regulator